MLSTDKKFVVFIPVRGGSKSIPLKNIKTFCGKPLIYWTAKAANDSPKVDAVYIATDSEKISSTVKSFDFPKVEVIGRSASTAQDTASTESAMLEFAESFSFENVVLVQATSPLLSVEDLNGGIEKFVGGNYDSVLSVVRQKRFIWREVADASIAVNYNPLQRPRRQDWAGYLVENGAFYITSRENLLRSKCRVSGRIALYEMSEDTYFEIDEPSDWIIMEQLLNKRLESVNE